MQHFPGHVVLGILLTGVAVGLRAASTNRLIRRRLWLSIALLVGYVLLNLTLAWTATTAIEPRLRSFEHLALALAVINGLVFVAFNPLRADRVPEHFPSILQDTIVVGLFLVVMTFVFEEKLLTTSAVGAVVIGFALQDTLGNAFSGLAIQIEKPFHVGDWLQIGGFEGRVHEVTWRAAKLRTKTGNLVVLPNNLISKEAITNFSEPAIPTRLHVDVGVSYLCAPNEAKAAIQEALDRAPSVLRSPAPDVVLLDFGDSAIVYRARFWIADFERDEPARDEVRSAIFYSFRRRQIEIPWPIRVNYARQDRPDDTPDRHRGRVETLARLDIFAMLDEDQRAALAAGRERVYADRETIVRQGDTGRSMFVILDGEVRITVDPGHREVARLGRGAYFGEMSLLTGDPRSATVAALGDCTVLEIADRDLRPLAEARPAIIERLGEVALARRKGLEATRDSLVIAGPGETTVSLAARIRRFLRIR